MKYFVKEKFILFLSFLLISLNCNIPNGSLSTSFLDISSFEDEFGDFNMDDMVLNQQGKEVVSNKSENKEKTATINEKKPSTSIPLRKITKIKITNNFEKNLPIKKESPKKTIPKRKKFPMKKKEKPKKEKVSKPDEEKQSEEKKMIKKEVENNKNNETSVLNSNFINDLLKLQNSSSKKSVVNNIPIRSSILRINKSLLNDNFKSEIIDSEKIKTLYRTISDLKADLNKKQIEEENLSFSKSKLGKNYENINNQVLISQAKLESELNELKFVNEIKDHFQTEKTTISDIQTKELDSKDFIKRISEDIKEKQEKITLYNKKLKDDIITITQEKDKLEKLIKDKSTSFEELKGKVDKVEKLKNQFVDSIKKNFESFDKKELNYLKVKDEEHEIELDIKNQENTEKLLALEIEHLKASNMLENKKIAELKIDLEKSKNIKDYLEKENEELREKVKITENENKQKQIDYEIKKTQLEDKLKKIRIHIDSLKKDNLKDVQYYSTIENDIKNKISYISLQNNNIIEKYPSKKIDEYPTNFIEKSARRIKEDKNKETKELIEFLNNNNIKNLDDLQRKLLGNEVKNIPEIDPNKNQENNNKQMINFLNQITS